MHCMTLRASSQYQREMKQKRIEMTRFWTNFIYIGLASLYNTCCGENTGLKLNEIFFWIFHRLQNNSFF